MMEGGRTSTSLTDKERLYEWGRQKAEDEIGRYHFPGFHRNEKSYLEDIEVQPELEEYDFKNRTDMERLLDTYFDEDLSEIKTECMRVLLKKLIGLEKEERKEDKGNRKVGVPEFIYNF